VEPQSSFERRFLDSLPTGVAIHVEGRLVYANPALCRMTGARSPGDWLGRPVLDFVPPAFHAATRERIAALYRKERPAEWVEVPFLRCDGSSFPAEVAASMVDWEGRPAAQTIVVDVSRRTRAQAELRESEERYRRVVEELPVGVVVHTGGRAVFVNREAGRVLGAEPAELLGQVVLDYIHPEDRERTRERIQRVYDKEGPTPFAPAQLVRRDGTVVDVDMCGAVVDWHGQPAAQVLFTDTTERRRLERRIQQAQKNESMEVLAGGVAHDFNNLLVGILGSAELALNALEPTAAARPLVERIGESARIAADLARQMLAYAGRARVVLDQVDPNALVAEMAGLLEAALPRKVRLRFEPGAALPPIEGDPTRLRQVVMNLVVNAGEAIQDREGHVTVRTGVLEADTETLRSPYIASDVPAGRYVAIEVVDDGSGMDEDVLRRLFDPFFSTKFAGRGLGLAAVLGIVRAHRGTILVESRPGAGSRLRVLLPAAPAPEEPPSRAPEGHLPAGRSTAADAGRAPCRGAVLVADDDDTVREIARHMLARAGWPVLEARDGEACLALFRARLGATGSDRIACVLLDLAMPRMDGHETLAALQALQPDVSVVVCSGFAEHDISAPADGDARIVFLAKPFASQELLAAIERACR